MRRAPSLRTRSLGARLLLFAAAAIATALTIAWLVLGILFERHAERQLRAELERHGLALIAAVSLDPEGRPVLSSSPFDPRFGRPASGLYWRIRSPAGEVRSRSLWDGDLATPPSPPQRGWGAAIAAGPFEERVLTVVRDVQLDAGGPDVLIEVGGDLAPVALARRAFGAESAVFLALLWLVLSLAAWIQVRLGLAPLDAVRRELDGLERRVDGRLDEARHPREIQPLTSAINTFADARAADVERARGRARDLAHALKTPLTALRLQIEALRPEARGRLSHSLSLVTGAVEAELARVGGQASSATPARAAEVIARLFAVIERTPDGARLDLVSTVDPDLSLPLGEAEALEALGALLENAARHAAARVRVTGGMDGQDRVLTVGDDGPGVPEADRAAILRRGGRLDETGAGHGLGLSIAREFVEGSGGTLDLGVSPEGGLEVILRW